MGAPADRAALKMALALPGKPVSIRLRPSSSRSKKQLNMTIRLSWIRWSPWRVTFMRFPPHVEIRLRGQVHSHPAIRS
jgi:hypothetical protein